MGLLSILPGIGDILDKFIPDASKRAEVKLELAKLADQEAARESQERIAQTEVNKVEAGSSSLFVAGWRPAVGWACVAGFSYTTLIAPAFGLGIADTSFLRDVLLGMLGISVAARSVEKIKGVAQNTLAGASVSGPTPEAPSLKSDVKKKKILGIAPWPF
jgi:hypothetical protein